MNLESVKPHADAIAVSAAGATFFKLLPDITALFALLYLLIRISETERAKQLLAWLRRLFKKGKS